MSPALSAAQELARSGGRGALITALPGGVALGRAVVNHRGALVAVDPGVLVPSSVVTGALDRIAQDRSGVLLDGETEWFIDVIAPPPDLRIFGAGPVAEALCRLGAGAGFRVVVGDPRPAHARPERFPDAVTVDCGWPDDLIDRRPLDDNDYVVSLLHAERFEDVLLPLVLRSPVRYVGALGSRQTHAARIERLRTAGFADADIGRIHGPVGLAIGAVTPEEIAVSILAEMVQVRRG